MLIVNVLIVELFCVAASQHNGFDCKIQISLRTHKILAGVSCVQKQHALTVLILKDSVFLSFNNFVFSNQILILKLNTILDVHFTVFAFANNM